MQCTAASNLMRYKDSKTTALPLTQSSALIICLSLTTSLSHLLRATRNVDGKYCPLLLWKSPNLETLIIKALKVYGYEGSCGELNQMRHFMKFLKVVRVKVQEEQDHYLSLTNDLTKLLSTASSKSKIQII